MKITRLSDFSFIIYRSLKIIYDEWIGYNSWMWKVKEHIEAIQDEERKVSIIDLVNE